ncbi:MAG: MFS transporter [Carbonactinosporaceae bacterium]
MLRRTFRSLRDHNYRSYFVGHGLSVTGTWMQRVGQDWLVLQLTNDAVALGISTAMQFGPILVLGAWGGVLADRIDRRRLLLFSQSAQLCLALALALLTATGVMRLWMVYVLALLLGFTTVVDNPARHAFVANLVGPEDYVNAQALNSTAHNTGRLVGPAIAGLIISSAGVAPVFMVNALSYLALITSLARMDPATMQPAHEPPQRAKGQIREGLRYVWSRPELRATMLLVFVIALLGQNFRVVLPMMAKDTFHGGAQAYGYLTAMLGLGAILGALGSAARQSVPPRALGVAAAGFGVMNLGMAVAPSLQLAYLLVAGVGIANLSFNTMARTLLQLNAERAMHGRVLALHGLVFLGTTPVGGPLLGWICETWNARAGFLVAGASALVAVGLALPGLRRAGPSPATEQPSARAGPEQ